MLSLLLEELKSAESALNINELSRKLDIDRSALEGMIDYLVKKGKLQDDDKAYDAAVRPMCNPASCGGSCLGPSECPFVVRLPRTFSLTKKQGD